MIADNDRDLLEKAAKAARIEWYGFFGDDEKLCQYLDIGADEVVEWNPLTDDGDALRLAVKLKLEIDIGANYVDVQDPLGNKTEIDSNIETCAYAATRRAIVRAAAMMGESL